jgi:ferredoxin
MRVRVDLQKCVGHGRCYDLAPEVFGEDDLGHCVLRREIVTGTLAEQAILGEENCPENAISVDEE